MIIRFPKTNGRHTRPRSVVLFKHHFLFTVKPTTRRRTNIIFNLKNFNSIPKWLFFTFWIKQSFRHFVFYLR